MGAAGDVTMPGNTPLTEGDFKPKPTPEELKERRKRGQKRKRSQKAKKGKKGKNQKTPTGAFKMNGMTFIPMQQQAQPQIVMMNGQPYMVMPQQQQFGGMMGGMQFANNLVGFGQQPKKKRRKNKKGKKKNDTTTNW